MTDLEARLREVAGASVLLVATDADALSARSEYTVVYRVPFFRSRWFFVLLAAGLAGLLGGVLLAQARRRAGLRRRRFNPYVAGAPVLDERLFFGRQPLVDRILQTVHNNSLLLYGERRIGKTSIQHHLKRRLLELEDEFEKQMNEMDVLGKNLAKHWAKIQQLQSQ